MTAAAQARYYERIKDDEDFKKKNRAKSAAARSRGTAVKETKEAAARRAADRRAKKRGGVPAGGYTTELVLEVFGAECHICGEEIDLDAPRAVGDTGWQQGLHLDHVIPLSRGGVDVIHNVRPAHGLCNMRKGNR